MPSQPSDEAPVLLQPVLTTMDEPMQKHKQEQALSKEREALSQPVQHKAKATTELIATQTCALDDDNLLGVGHEQTKVESMTARLLRCGGDIRTLLVNQPPSTFHAMASNDDDAGKVAGQTAAAKQEAKAEDEEEDDEEEENERFVRPPRLRFVLSQEAASDGFPSAIALSRRWHPDHMQDLPGDANLSIREAFDNKHDEYYVFRHWRPSQGK